ncbi:substrate-binding periplasmic protein [Rhodoferax sp.]|uniref:substrate-binding periplasmic protein n=1 Tax=Rhodoferax sp. TaxID=50421 RepID=UPI003A0FE0E1
MSTLLNLRIGVERGSYLSPELNSPAVRLDFANSMEANLLKLAKGRVDLVFGDRNAGLFVIASVPALLRNLEWKGSILESKNDYLALAKSVPNRDALLIAFNQGLRAMQMDGSFSRLLLTTGIDAAR